MPVSTPRTQSPGGSIDRALLDALMSGQGQGGGQRDEADQLTAALARMGMRVDEDALVFRGDMFVLPEQFAGNVKEAIKFLEGYVRQGEQLFKISRTFRYRPYDVAAAFFAVMRNVTGSAGFGVTKMTLMGRQLPRFETVNISPTETIQVPQGVVEFPVYQAQFHVGRHMDEEHGPLGRIEVEAPRKWRNHIEFLFVLIEEHLVKHSIYRGKAITGGETPEFITISIDPARVAYSKAVEADLQAHLWTPLARAEQCREEGIPLRRAVLLAGPYGSGKTLAGMLTGKIAVQHGWTFIHCRPGQDDPEYVLRTARLYAPAVVLIEDIDVYASGGDAEYVSKLLEMLDGASTKGGEVVAVFTTNNPEKLLAGTLRPGRIDALIEIDGFDLPALEALIRSHVNPKRLKNIDYTAVYEAFKGFQPAFAVEAITRAMRFALARGDGDTRVLTTEDLIGAARGLHRQLEYMARAVHARPPATVDHVLKLLIAEVLGRTSVPDFEEKLEVATPSGAPQS